MLVSCARQASATGLSSPDANVVNVIRTFARSIGARGRVVGARGLVVVDAAAGLVGGNGVVVADFDDPLLLHAAATSAMNVTSASNRRRMAAG
jgi:hypothetical protein